MVTSIELYRSILVSAAWIRFQGLSGIRQKKLKVIFSNKSFFGGDLTLYCVLCGHDREPKGLNNFNVHSRKLFNTFPVLTQILKGP